MTLFVSQHLFLHCLFFSLHLTIGHQLAQNLVLYGGAAGKAEAVTVLRAALESVQVRNMHTRMRTNMRGWSRRVE